MVPTDVIENARRLLAEYVQLGGERIVRDPVTLMRIGAAITVEDSDPIGHVADVLGGGA